MISPATARNRQTKLDCAIADVDAYLKRYYHGSPIGVAPKTHAGFIEELTLYYSEAGWNVEESESSGMLWLVFSAKEQTHEK